MNEFAKKVRDLREDQNLSMERLGDAVGLSKGSISLLEKGEMAFDGKEFGPMVRLCVLTGTDPRNLIDLSKVKKYLLPENSVGLMSRKIILLDYSQAAEYQKFTATNNSGEGMTVKEVQGELAEILSGDSFAMIVVDDSMTPMFKIGDEIYIDPQEECRPGDIVVARIDSTNEATLKKYRLKGADSEGHPIIELVPLNEDYPTIVVDSGNPGSVIGPVVRHSTDPRRK